MNYSGVEVCPDEFSLRLILHKVQTRQSRGMMGKQNAMHSFYIQDWVLIRAFGCDVDWS